MGAGDSRVAGLRTKYKWVGDHSLARTSHLKYCKIEIKCVHKIIAFSVRVSVGPDDCSCSILMVVKGNQLK